jgi:alkyl sulfatase BDS1-like metallo-beta-lactamase superfamily hydrolase
MTMKRFWKTGVLALALGHGVAAQAQLSDAERAAVIARLPADDGSDMADATRGKLAEIPGGLIRTADGKTVWDAGAFAFLDAETAPASVHPSLWRQARLNRIHGLFEIVPGKVWQVRGYDIAVMTIISGKTGWIVIDPLLTEEAAAAAMALAQSKIGKRPVSAVLFTHSHADHFGGVGGIISADEVRQRKVPIVAPHGFAEEAVSENVLAGNAMTRRSSYMFGTALAPGAQGRVDNGLGTGLSIGTTGYLAPNMLIGPEGGMKTIDGVRFDFMDAAGTEAPAEFLFYLPDFKVLHTTEVSVKTLHNILTLRGAQVRDALRWSKIIDAALVKWGGEAQVQIASHNWPTWGQGRVAGYLESQRDAYRYVHDRTLGRANAGLTLHEVADGIAEPAAQQQSYAARGYYGTVNHNMKATYQRYYGWWDGVPANFNPMPPVAAAKGYVELAGGADALLAAGKKAQGAGNHRWAAELLNHLVFAEPANAAAKAALADSYEALGFAAESGIWRNYYLSGAATLRGTELPRRGASTQSRSFISAIPTAEFFDALATRFAAERSGNMRARINFILPDTKETLGIMVNGDVEIPRYGATLPDANATVTLNRRDFDAIVLGETDFPKLMQSGAMTIEGDSGLFLRWLMLHPPFDPAFAVVTP